MYRCPGCRASLSTRPKAEEALVMHVLQCEELQLLMKEAGVYLFDDTAIQSEHPPPKPFMHPSLLEVFSKFSEKLCAGVEFQPAAGDPWELLALYDFFIPGEEDGTLDPEQQSQQFRCHCCDACHWSSLKGLEDHMLENSGMDPKTGQFISHGIGFCDVCQQQLSIAGLNTVERHQRETGHFGIKHACYWPIYSYVCRNNEECTLCEQYYCEACEVVFPLAIQFAVHMEEVHSETEHGQILQAHTHQCLFCPQSISFASYRQLWQHYLSSGHDAFTLPSLVIAHYLLTEPPHYTRDEEFLQQNKNRLGYQCPDCHTIFLDDVQKFNAWAGMKKHLWDQKHGLAQCGTCFQYVDVMPTEETAPLEFLKRQHPDLLSGQKLIGVLSYPSFFETLVDVTDCHIATLINEKKPDGRDLKYVYQCPLQSCLLVATSATSLRRHLATSEHGVITCPVEGCGEKLMSWTLSSHVHPIDVPVTHHLYQKEATEDFLVAFIDAELAAYHIQKNCIMTNRKCCPDCQHFRSALKNIPHVENGECDMLKKHPEKSCRSAMVNAWATPVVRALNS